MNNKNLLEQIQKLLFLKGKKFGIIGS